MMVALFDTIDAARDYFSARALLERALGEMERELVFLATMVCALATEARGGGMAEVDDALFLSLNILDRKIHRILGQGDRQIQKHPSPLLE